LILGGARRVHKGLQIGRLNRHDRDLLARAADDLLGVDGKARESGGAGKSTTLARISTTAAVLARTATKYRSCSRGLLLIDVAPSQQTISKCDFVNAGRKINKLLAWLQESNDPDAIMS
jgi:hypothetical protein